MIHQDQTGFIKGRNIKDNIMETYLTTVASKEGALILLDFEKAYNRMDRGWIKTVMTNMNLGVQFVDWSMKLIEQSQVRVTTDVISERFMAMSGVRQGCLLSLLIFDLGMEPLAIELRDKLSGIEVEGQKAKVSLYTDDTEIFTKDHFDVKTSKKVLKKFNKQSTMQININKSSMLDLGERRIL